MAHGGALLEVLKIVLGIEFKVPQVLSKAWRRLPSNFTVGIYVAHRISPHDNSVSAWHN